MQPKNRRLGAAFVCWSVFAPCALAAVINEEFNGTLHPAWQVVAFSGTRAYGYTSPANHYSLTDNAGRFRYYMDPMTHMDTFVYPQTSNAVHSCCTHDPGLEIRMQLPDSEQWTIESAGDFYLPYTNGRHFTFTLYFGDGGLGTYGARFMPGRDVNGGGLNVILMEKTADVPAQPWTNLEAYNLLNTSDVPIPYLFRLNRDGGLLTAQYSLDGSLWTTAYSHDMGSALDGLDQWVAINGASWFNAGGSYADWDYVHYADTVPEPSAALMLLTGGLLIGLRRLLPRR